MDEVVLNKSVNHRNDSHCEGFLTRLFKHFEVDSQ